MNKNESDSLLTGLFCSRDQWTMATPATDATAQLEVVTDLQSFASLEQEWEQLWHVAKGTPFQQFRYYFHALHEVAIPAGATLHCIVGRKDGRMVLGWPLMRYRERLWTTVRPLAPDPSDQSDLLVANGEDLRSIVSAAWHVLRASCRSDLISLPMVRTDSALHRLGSQQKWLSRGEPRVVRVAPLLRHKSWAEFRGGLPAAFRKEQDYHYRRLQRAGEAAMFIADLDDPGSAVYMSAMYEWKHQWAARVGAGGNFFTESYQNFLRKISADPSFTRTLRLFVLSLDGKAIAVNLVVISERAVMGIQSAYSPAHAKLSPGSLLLEHITKWAFENQRELDFGPGDNKYKSNWTESGYTCTDFRIALSHWGRTVLAARTFRDQWRDVHLRLSARPLGRT